MPKQTKQDPQAQGIQGVFSTQSVRKVGTGTTVRKTIQKSYWFAVEQDNQLIEIQMLNANYVPSGPKRRIPKNEFLEKFAPEPEFYVSKVFPKIKEVAKTVARADRHRKNKEFFSAEMEYGNALKIDEENIRANFGLGITYLERGENDKAKDILGRLVKLEGAFESKHKHLFNEFGINLRKNKLYDQSIAYYSRALELSEGDEHLYYNLARAYYEKKSPGTAVNFLLMGLELNPLQDSLLAFLVWMLAKDLVPDEKRQEALAVLQKAKILRETQTVSQTPGANPEDPQGENI